MKVTTYAQSFIATMRIYEFTPDRHALILATNASDTSKLA